MSDSAEHDVLLHYTTAAAWQRSEAAGQHVMSGRDRTLEAEGFIHFCTPAQREGVWKRHWAGIPEPVVLLQVDVDRLAGRLVYENTSGGDELFPHLYDALPVDAVTSVRQVDGGGRPH